MTEVARLEAILTANTTQYTRKMREAEGQTSRMGGVMNKAKYAAVGLGVGGVAVAAKFMETSVKAAMDAQKSQVRLDQAFKTSHLSAKVYGTQLDALETRSRKLGFSDEDVKNSLGSLLIATHSMKKATQDLGVAQDIARFKNVSLEQATKTLTMAQAGSQRATKQLGIDVPKVTTSYDKLKATVGSNTSSAEKLALAQAKINDKQATAALVIETVRQKLGGQADAYSKTAAGGMAQFHAQVQHIEVAIGTKLLPAMAAMFTKLNQLLVWSQENWPKIRSTVETTFRVIVATIRGFYTTIADLVKFWNDLLHGRWSKFWEDIKNLALDMVNPLHLAAGKIAHAVWSGFTGALDDGWKAVKQSISGLFGKVIGWVKSVLGINSPSTVFHEIGQHSVQGFINGVGSMGGILKHAVIHMAEDAVKHLGGSIGGAIGGIVHAGGFGHLTGGDRRMLRHEQQQVINAVGFARSLGWRGQITSGFRTRAEQEVLWQRYLHGGPLAARPGTSSHEKGQAVDVTDYGKFAQTMMQAPGGYKLYNRLGGADPVHFSVTGYDKGGWLPTGLSLAMNATGKPERVVGPGGDTAVFHIDLGPERLATVVFDLLRRKAKVYENRNGRLAFGGM